MTPKPIDVKCFRSDIDDHLDTMQTDLESLRELLRSDSYALDTNTLMGVSLVVLLHNNKHCVERRGESVPCTLPRMFEDIKSIGRFTSRTQRTRVCQHWRFVCCGWQHCRPSHVVNNVL